MRQSKKEIQIDTIYSNMDVRTMIILIIIFEYNNYRKSNFDIEILFSGDRHYMTGWRSGHSRTRGFSNLLIVTNESVGEFVAHL